MLYSKYNHLFQSKKYGFFIYNSRTNSFFKLEKSLYNLLSEKNKNQNAKIEIDKEIEEALINAKILVGKTEDANFYNQKKLLKYKNSFSTSTGMGIVIAPTMACNFVCPYCYEAGLPVNKMTKKVENGIIKFIEETNEVGKDLTLCWHGGEPLICFDVMDRILTKIRTSEKINLKEHHLVTNGYLLDIDKCKKLKEHKLNSIQITIDGLPETHNKSRKHKSGLPTFDKIIEGIDNVTEIIPECRVNLRVNLHKENMKDFNEIYSFLTERWKDKNTSVHMVYAANHGTCNVKCIQQHERIGFFKELYEKYNFKNINFFPEFKEVGCTADFVDSYVVGPEGELYKCWVDLGKEDRVVGDIFTRRLNYSILAEYLVGTDMFNDEKCKECKLFPVCDGGCSLYRYEHKLKGTPYNVCPIDIKDLDIMLELHYEQNMLSK